MNRPRLSFLAAHRRQLAQMMSVLLSQRPQPVEMLDMQFVAPASEGVGPPSSGRPAMDDLCEDC